MLTAPEVVAEAVRSGLVTTDQVLDGTVAVSDRSRSNDVLVVTVDERPLVYVKQRGVASWADGDDAVRNEVTALTGLAGLGLVPRVVLAREDSVWTQAVTGTPLNEVRGSVPELARLCGAWGSATARLHAWPLPPDAPAAPEPWVLHPDRLPASMQVARGAEFDAVLEVVVEPDLVHAVSAARRAWTRTSWVHGDLSPANVLADALREGTPRVSFLDVESAGAGCPAWDLVTATAAIVSLAPAWGSAPEPLVERFVTAYREADGPGRTDPSLHAVRAVTTAWQVACQVHLGKAEIGGVQDMLRRAREHAARAVLVGAS